VILMVSEATRSEGQYHGHSALGRLAQPRLWNNIDTTVCSRQLWTADNDALAGIDPDAHLSMLDAIDCASLSGAYHRL
jgi:hypothetical protein